MWAYEFLPQQGQEGAVQPNVRLGPVERREPARGTASGPHTGMLAARHVEPNRTLAPAAPPGVLQSQARPEGQAGDWNGWLQNADVAPAQGSVWATVNERQEERPLSLAQIEQVLAALDERLELMLLRMYGSAGGLS